MRFFLPLLALPLCLLPRMASAGDGYCDELWFTRNAIFHEAGYCFGSPLGQAVFGNAGCTTKNPALTAAQSARLARVKAAEAGCVVDSSRTSLDIPDLDIRRRLSLLPIRADAESSCIGWKGGPVALRSGPGDAAAPLFTLAPGDTVLFSHEPEEVGGLLWDYVQVYQNGAFRKAGWTRFEYSPANCEQLAG